MGSRRPIRDQNAAFPTMKHTETASIASIPAADINPRTRVARILRATPAVRSVLEHLGFDTIATGECSLAEVCEARGLDAPTVAKMLSAFAALVPTAPAMALETMGLTELCDYLETVRHPELESQLTRIDSLVRTLADEHGAEEARFQMIHDRFENFRKKTIVHLREEADVLFPLIRRMESGSDVEYGGSDRLRVPLARMKDEHNEVDEDLAALEAFTTDDLPSGAASAPLRLLRDSFQKLEGILQGQIYQENQVLFRRALASLPSS